MKRSFLSRIAGAAVALGLGTTTLAAIGLATPASAATGASCTTEVSITSSGSTIEYGAFAYIDGRTSVVSCSGGSNDPSGPWSDAGKTLVERSVNNGASWQAVYTDVSYGTDWSGRGIIRASGLYRIRYTGGTSAEFGDSFSGSTSPAVRINVVRKVDVRDKSNSAHSVGRFKLSPTTGLVGKKVVFQVKKGGKWKRYKAVKVRASGVWKTVFKNSRRGIKYRLVVPAAGGLSGYTYGPYTATRR